MIVANIPSTLRARIAYLKPSQTKRSWSSHHTITSILDPAGISRSMEKDLLTDSGCGLNYYTRIHSVNGKIMPLTFLLANIAPSLANTGAVGTGCTYWYNVRTGWLVVVAWYGTVHSRSPHAAGAPSRTYAVGRHHIATRTPYSSSSLVAATLRTLARE